MKLTNQERVNWFSKQNRLLKQKLKKKTSFARIVSQNFDKLILNQSPFTQDHLLKFFLSKRYFLEPLVN